VNPIPESVVMVWIDVLDMDGSHGISPGHPLLHRPKRAADRPVRVDVFPLPVAKEKKGRHRTDCALGKEEQEPDPALTTGPPEDDIELAPDGGSTHRRFAHPHRLDAERGRPVDWIPTVDVAAKQLQDFPAANAAPLLRRRHRMASIVHQWIRARDDFP
jgi:hypothetical protein